MDSNSDEQFLIIKATIESNKREVDKKEMNTAEKQMNTIEKQMKTDEKITQLT